MEPGKRLVTRRHVGHRTADMAYKAGGLNKWSNLPEERMFSSSAACKADCLHHLPWTFPLQTGDPPPNSTFVHPLYGEPTTTHPPPTQTQPSNQPASQPPNQPASFGVAPSGHLDPPPPLPPSVSLFLNCRHEKPTYPRPTPQTHPPPPPLPRGLAAAAASALRARSPPPCARCRPWPPRPLARPARRAATAACQPRAPPERGEKGENTGGTNAVDGGEIQNSEHEMKTMVETSVDIYRESSFQCFLQDSIHSRGSMGETGEHGGTQGKHGGTHGEHMGEHMGNTWGTHGGTHGEHMGNTWGNIGEAWGNTWGTHGEHMGNTWGKNYGET